MFTVTTSADGIEVKPITMLAYEPYGTGDAMATAQPPSLPSVAEPNPFDFTAPAPVQQTAPAVYQNAYINFPEQGSAVSNVASMAIASMILGLVSFIIAFVPFVSIVALPVGVLGLVLGLIGLSSGARRRSSGIGFSISGVALNLMSVGAIMLPWLVLMWSRASEAAERREEERRTMQRARSSATAPAKPPGRVNPNRLDGRHEEEEEGR